MKCTMSRVTDVTHHRNAYEHVYDGYAYDYDYEYGNEHYRQYDIYCLLSSLL